MTTMATQTKGEKLMVCTGEFLWKSLSLHLDFVATTSCTKSNQIELVQLLLLWQNSVVETTIFTKILQYTQRIFSLQCVTQLVTWPEHKELFVAPMCYSNMFPSVSQSLVSREPSTTTPTFDTELLPTHLQLCLGLGYLPAPGTMPSTSIFFGYPRLDMGDTHSRAKT